MRRELRVVREVAIYVTPCGLVNGYRCFGQTYCLLIQSRMRFIVFLIEYLTSLLNGRLEDPYHFTGRKFFD